MTRNARGVAFLLGMVACVAFVVCLPHTADAQAFLSIFDGSSLSGWKADHRDADAAGGVLTLKKGSGWVRTQRVYADFVLRLDVRAKAGAVASVFVRAWPTFGPERNPNNGHLFRMTGQKVEPGSDGWRRVEIECIGRNLTVRVDGAVVYTSTTVENPQGHIAVAAGNETAQFRSIEVQEKRPPYPQPSETGPRAVGKGVSSPTVVENAKPRYTAEAMRARITGKVIMSGVVAPDGTVSDVQLVQSLDPHFGLDRQAMETASKWRFEPGRLEGEPVAVRIIIELEFNLK